MFTKLLTTLTPCTCYWWSPDPAKLLSVILTNTYLLSLKLVPFLLSDDETQFKASGSVSQQDVFGNKISKEHKIAKFTRNDSWASVLGKIWEEFSTEDQHTKQGRHLRWVALTRESSVPGENLSMSWTWKSKANTHRSLDQICLFPENFYRNISSNMLSVKNIIQLKTVKRKSHI